MSRHRPYTYRSWHLGAIVLLAWCLHLPTLRMGFFADDYGHQVALRGLSPESPMKPWNLYDFGTAPRPGDAMHQLGAYPWWTPPEWKARFFRPLTSLSLWLDHIVFGGWATGYHLTSLAIFGILILLLFGLFRAVGLGDRTSVVALLIFVCGDSALLPVGWPANRNTLLECTFLVGAVLAAIRAVRLHRVWLTVLAVVLGLGALLSKESGIEAMVLIPAFTYWVHDRSRGTTVSWTTRVMAVVCLLIAVIYLVLYVAAGMGTTTAFYPMPWTEPVAFATRLFVLIAVAPFSFLGFAPVDLFSLAPAAALPSGLLCAIPAAFLVAGLWRWVRHNPTASLWGFWLLVTVLPQGTPPTSDRLLFVPSVGAAALLAILLTSVASVESATPVGRVVRRAVVFGTLVVSPIMLLLAGALLSQLARHGRTALLKMELPDAGAGQRELFLLQGPNDLVAAMALSTLTIERGAADLRVWPIQLGGRSLRWTRVDERAFDFETLDEPFFTNLIEIVFLNTTDAPPVGTMWTAALFTVEATESTGGGPRRFRVRLKEPPDDPRYRFYAVDANMRFQSVPLPAIGTSVDLPRVPPALPGLELLSE